MSNDKFDIIDLRSEFNLFEYRVEFWNIPRLDDLI